MAQLQLERKIKVSDNSQTSPTFEQLLRVEETYRSTNTSPTFRISHDAEEPLSPSHNKKSVLTKVKERAKKLRYSLSGKRRFENDPSTHHTAPQWGVTTLDHYSDDDDDGGEKDSDPEYLGAPMYESEAAPQALKETARQHPRAVPVVAESHRVPNRMSLEDEKPVSPNTTMSGAVSEKLGPAYNAMSDATHKIASKIAGLAVTSQETQEQEPFHTQTARNASQIDVPAASSESKKMSQNGGHLSPQTWDKGVSIKEYFLTKLEPGEDEKALSQAITEAMSPTKANTNKDTGVVEKMKEAVSSLFWQEEITNTMTKSASLSSSTVPASSNGPTSTQHRQINSAIVQSSKDPHSANSSPAIPLSSNAYEVHEEENHGKILQAN
ncbi:hypothetical protein ACS0TY_007964 [Phlomoides rotata]